MGTSAGMGTGLKDVVARLRIKPEVSESVTMADTYPQTKSFIQYWGEVKQMMLKDELEKQAAWKKAILIYKEVAEKIYPSGQERVALSADLLAQLKRKGKKKEGRIEFDLATWEQLMESAMTITPQDIITKSGQFESLEDMHEGMRYLMDAMLAAECLDKSQEALKNIKAASDYVENDGVKQGLNTVRQKFQENPLLMAMALSTPDKDKGGEQPEPAGES